MTRKILIAGIDPGTTTAYALLDTDGKIIAKNSSKELEINQLIKEITKFGEIIAIGTDKKKTPFLIQKISARIGAKIITPNEDLKIIEKTSLIEDEKGKNAHENDSIACANFAYKKIKGVLGKIKEYCEKENKIEQYNELAKLVIIEKISIRHASEIIEEETKVEKIIETEKIESIDPKYIKLKEQIKRLNKENTRLRIYSEILKQNNKKLKKIAQKKIQTEKTINIKVHKLTKNRERNNLSLQKTINEKNNQISEEKNYSNKIEQILRQNKEWIIAEKIKTLEHNEVKNLREGKTIFVENPNIYSDYSVSQLKNVQTVVHLADLTLKTKKLLPYTFVKVDKIKCKNFKNFLAIEKNSLEEEIKKQSSMERVVEQYREERKNTINH